MVRFIAASIAVMFLVSSWSHADQTQVTQLQNQIRELKAHHRAMVRDTEARYKSLSKKTRLSEDERRTLRHQIHLEEERLIALTQDPAAKQKIRDQYDHLRHSITKGIQLDEAARQKMVAHGRAQVHTINVTYHAHLNELERRLAIARAQNNAQAKIKKKK